ncbi:DNA polymerase III subunit chi [Pseudooceanicola sediminis]|uniref:DNA polymerase III subunit chi n=1 Tax=Pseudooceanicola sediminis TaxID=2211117 RepID=A0A399J5P2_9RHOB|nr:DNA polymerase III subunit chi [Pseudooceanicola sediminis]KAA2316911.1 DNA polymerase III subunit chi [Puniceibacterium sp. HSS470]RII40808.1 DNA polymerase III subunit chi [Pseudooceanicola sediminis]
MGEVYFYHLTHSSVDGALQNLLPRALGAGWRVAVRGQEAERLDWLDQKLWLGRDDDFLPHGQDKDPHPELQPILLTLGAASNAPDCLMSIDGAPLDVAEVESSKRSCILFDGSDEQAVAHARIQWKSLTGAGCAAVYWSEESGRWQKKAETAGR